MQSLGAFKNVEVTLDTPNDNGRPMGIEGLSEVDVVLNVKERPRIWAKTGTEVGNYEGNMVSDELFIQLLSSILHFANFSSFILPIERIIEFAQRTRIV